MWVDSQLLFSDAQAITASAASTNLVDLQNALRDIGSGRTLYWHLNVDVAFTDAGSDSTVTVTVEQDTTAAFGSATVIQTLGTFGALSAVGDTIKEPMTLTAASERFIRLNYTVANGNLTTGSITATLVLDVDNYESKPDNVTFTSS